MKKFSTFFIEINWSSAEGNAHDGQTELTRFPQLSEEEMREMNYSQKEHSDKTKTGKL